MDIKRLAVCHSGQNSNSSRHNVTAAWEYDVNIGGYFYLLFCPSVIRCLLFESFFQAYCSSCSHHQCTCWVWAGCLFITGWDSLWPFFFLVLFILICFHVLIYVWGILSDMTVQIICVGLKLFMLPDCTQLQPRHTAGYICSFCSIVGWEYGSVALCTAVFM